MNERRKDGELFGILILFQTIINELATEEQKREIYRDLDIWINIDDPEISPEFLDGMKEVINDLIKF